MKRPIKYLVKKLGYTVNKIQNHAPPESSMITLYNAAMLGVFSSGYGHIVIVGANDGKLGDPSYDLLMGVAKPKSAITLIEPQKSLISLVYENFSGHPDVTVINGAIAPQDELILYSIDEKIWPYTQPSYAIGWPDYRAPTGVTSGRRELVVKWGREVIRDIEWRDEYVTENRVPAFDLKTALSRHTTQDKVDILQIDAEGLDDIVLRCCNLEKTKPKLIRFEAKHISHDRLDAALSELSALGYHCVLDNFDVMAFLMK